MRNKINDESLSSFTKEKTLLQEIDEVSETHRYSLGTMLHKDQRVLRYARAGSKLKANKKAYAYFPDRPTTYEEARTINIENLISAVWSDIRSRGTHGSIVGIPLVDVGRGQYFWLLVWPL